MRVDPGHYGEFTVLAMGLPDDTDSLTFRAVRSYDDGTEVSWIETDAGAERPAPVVTLTAAEAEARHGGLSSQRSANLAGVVLVVTHGAEAPRQRVRGSLWLR